MKKMVMILLMAIVIGVMSNCGTGDEKKEEISCEKGMQRYQSKCVYDSVISFMTCIEGRGQDVIFNDSSKKEAFVKLKSKAFTFDSGIKFKNEFIKEIKPNQNDSKIIDICDKLSNKAIDTNQTNSAPQTTDPNKCTAIERNSNYSLFVKWTCDGVEHSQTITSRFSNQSFIFLKEFPKEPKSPQNDSQQHCSNHRGRLYLELTREDNFLLGQRTFEKTEVKNPAEKFNFDEREVVNGRTKNYVIEGHYSSVNYPVFDVMVKVYPNCSL